MNELARRLAEAGKSDAAIAMLELNGEFLSEVGGDRASSSASSIVSAATPPGRSNATRRPSRNLRSTRSRPGGWRSSRRGRNGSRRGTYTGRDAAASPELVGGPVRMDRAGAVLCGKQLAHLPFHGTPGQLGTVDQRSLLEWWLWALLTPIVVWLARRFPLDRPWRWRNVLFHVLAGVFLSVLKASVERVAFAWLTGVWTYWLVSTLALTSSPSTAPSWLRRTAPSTTSAAANAISWPPGWRTAAAAAAQHATAAALPVQHAEHDRGTGSQRSKRR